MHRMYIDEIVKKGDKNAMTELGCIFVEAMDHIKICDHDLYESLEEDMYEIIYGEKFTEDKARDVIMDMRPYGMKKTLDESKKIMAQYGITSIDPIDFWIVINSMMNDYCDIFDDNEEMYVNLAKHFINDEDAGEHKVYKYFTTIPKK